jgi:Bacterial Ig-like domain/FG-GAP-like repeat
MRRFFRQLMTKPLTHPRRVGLNLLPLEDRVVPATFTVTNTNDAGAGSLRQAVIDANTAAGADIIEFDNSFNTPQVIQLSSAQILISSDITINGKGAGLTTVQSTQAVGASSRVFNIDNGTTSVTAVINGLTITGGNLNTTGIPSRGAGFNINVANVTINDSVITGNASVGRGGGFNLVASTSVLSLNRSIVSNNKSTDSAAGDGAGISIMAGGTLNLTDSTVSGNLANDDGAGLYFFNAGTLNMSRSTISGNIAGTGAGADGGGIYLFSGVNATINNSTISGNSAGRGGGIIIKSANTIVNISNSTITNNNNTNAASTNAAGGISRTATATGTGVTSIVSSIVAGNTTANATSSPDVNILGGALNATTSLIGSSDGLTITGSGNLTGSNASLLDAKLGALANNGGITGNHQLLAGSPALNVGSNPLSLSTDQRGTGFSRVFGAAADMGSFEVSPFGSPTATGTGPNVTSSGGTIYTFTVTYNDLTSTNQGINVSSVIGNNSAIQITGPGAFTTNATYVSIDNNTNGPTRTATYTFIPPGGSWDSLDNGAYQFNMVANKVKDIDNNFVPAGAIGSFTVGIPVVFLVTNTNDDTNPGSLRRAIQDSNAAPTPDIITFDPTFFNVPRTINITNQLSITDSVTINGPGSKLLSVTNTAAASSTTRIFLISGPSTLNVNISGQTLSGGQLTTTIGAGLLIDNENVSLNDVVVSNNKTLLNTGSGAGGGGIFLSIGGQLSLVNSRVSGNVATGSGGGIYADTGATVNLLDSTVSGNISSGVAAAKYSGSGGGIYMYNSGTLNVIRSTISGNSALGTGTAFSGFGGGIYMFGTLNAFNITNSTISGNKSNLIGGGVTLRSSTGTASFTNTTITNNTSSDPTLGGGGIGVTGTTGTLSLTSSVVAGNFVVSGPLDVAREGNAVTASNSFFGSSEGLTITGSGNKGLGSNGAPADPMLNPLGNYGGPTQTHSSMTGSPLRDVGSNTLALTTDQRGRPRVFGAAADIGAFEYNPPSVVSLISASASPTNATSVTYTITFSEIVTGVTATNFALVTTGTAAGVIGTPTTADGFVWTIPVASLAGQGTLRLNFVNITGIVDPVVGALPVTGTLLTIDRVNPTVGITRATPNPFSNAAVVTFNIIFSEPVATLTLANLQLVGTATSGASFGTLTTLTPSTYKVTVNTGVEGTLGINLINSTGLADTPGFALNPVLNTPIVGELFTIDKTAPLLSSITRDNPTTNNLNSVSWTVTFNEDVTGVSAANFSLYTNGTIGGTSFTIVAQSASVYTVIANTGTGDGTVGLDLDDNTGITDLATNAFTGFGIAFADYLIDRTSPTLIITRTGPTALTNSATLSFDLVFSEDITGLADTNFTLTGTSTGATITSVTGSGTTWTLIVAAGTDGTLGLDLTTSIGLIDQASNAVTPLPTVGEIYTVDRTPPTVTDFGTGTGATILPTYNFVVQFNEPVTGITPASFTISTVGTTGATISSVTGSGNTYTVSVTTGTSDGTIVLNFLPAGVTDAATNPAVASSSSVLAVDRTNPNALSVVADTILPTNAGSVSWTVTFNEKATGLTNANFTLSSTGTLAGFNITGITANAGGLNYTITAATGTGDGNLLLSLTSTAGITDLAGNPLNNTLPTLVPITIDKTAPVVASITRDTSSVSNAGSVTWTVTLSETVVGLTLNDLNLIFGGSTTGATLTGLTGSGATYQVSATTGNGDGTLGLGFNSSIPTDVATNPINPTTFAGEVYTIDKSNPLIVSITTTGPSLTNSGFVTWNVVFSEAVTGLSASNFNLPATGVAFPSISAVNGSGLSYTIQVNTGNGDGSLGLQLANSTGLIDQVGKPVLTLPVDAPTYTIDKTAATVTSVTRTGSTNTKSNTISWTLVLSEPVTGLQTSNFTVVSQGPNGAAISSLTGSGTTYTLTMTTGSGDGALGFALNLNGVTDAATNGSSGIVTSPTYTIDKTRPGVVLSTTGSTIAAPTYTVTATFNEAVTGVNLASFTVTNGTASNLVAVSPTTYTFTVSAVKAGNVTVSIASNTINDLAQNLNTASNALVTNVAPPAPTATITTTANSRTNSTSLAYTVTFSEPVTGFGAGKITATNGTVGNFVQVDATTFTYTITPTTDGVVSGSIPAGAAASSLGVNNAAATSPLVTFDKTKPTVTITVASGQANPSSTKPVSFTVVFSEPVTGFTASSLTLAGTGSPTATVTGSGTTYTVTIGGIFPGAVSASVNIGGATDLAGNTSNGSSRASITFAPPLDQIAVGSTQSTQISVLTPSGAVASTTNAFPDNPEVQNVRVVMADFNGDKIADRAVGSGPGSETLVRVIDGSTGEELFFVSPFEAEFTGGVYLAVGDVDGDGRPDLIVSPDEGGGPRVQVYSGARKFVKVLDFLGIEDAQFRGGARVAVGDFNGDGRAELAVAAGFGGGPRVQIWDTVKLLSTGAKGASTANFFAFESALRNGAFIAAGDINGDGIADLVFGGGPGGGPRVRIFDGGQVMSSGVDNLDKLPDAQVANFFGGDATNRGGIHVAVKDLDGDNKMDLVLGAGVGAGSRVTGYYGRNITKASQLLIGFETDVFDGVSGGVFVG